MTKGEKDRLIGRLKLESGKMRNKFADLADRTREALEKNKTSVKDLELLIKFSDRNNLVNLFKKKKTVYKLFYALSDRCSFFDYEFLSVIINRYCPELKPLLDDYEAHFKTFCQCRLCEIPSDIFTKKRHTNNLYVKYNQSVDQMTLETAKDLEIKLSELLKTELYLLEVHEGCVELVFDSCCDLNDQFPLSKQQKEHLDKMGVIRLNYSNYTHSLIKDANGDLSSDATGKIVTTNCTFGEPSYFCQCKGFLLATPGVKLGFE